MSLPIPPIHLWRLDLAGRADGRAYTRAALRVILGETLGLSPADVPIETSALGQPRLPAEFGWHFSVSHATERALIAVARFPVGVDLEPRAAFETLDPAVRELVLSPAERAAGAPLGVVWTRKEALLKALGVGFSRDPATVTVWPDAGPDWIWLDLAEPFHEGALCWPAKISRARIIVKQFT